MSSTGNCTQLQLNFQNHCLLCLQYVDPEVIKDLWEENPKGLHNFQPVLQYLTGTVDLIGGGKIKHYPVSKNFPPLCTICYDILAEMHIFHLELMEIQRKIQNQTEAARRIARGTMRKNGGMRSEFFNRLKIADVSKKEMSAMEYFLTNFHGLITEADRKAVLPQLFSLTFNGGQGNSSSPISSPTKTILQPYSVEFLPPTVPSIAQPLSQVSSPIALYTINNLSSAPTTWLITNNTAMLVQKLPDSSLSATKTQQTKQVTSSSPVDEESRSEGNAESDVLLSGPFSATYEFEEGNEELEDAGGELMTLSDNTIDGHSDNQIMLEEKTELHIEHNDEHDEDAQITIFDNAANEELDVNYWKSVLSSQIIIEDVDKEGHGTPKELYQGQNDIELIELDDDDIEDQSVLSYTAATGRERTRSGGTSANTISTESGTKSMVITLQDPSARSSHEITPPVAVTQQSNNQKPGIGYRCSECGKNYHSLQRLNYHKQGHLPGGRPKPHRCPYCDKTFSVKNLMDQHQNTHTGERPYKCKICGDSFRQTSTLYRHKLIHKK